MSNRIPPVRFHAKQIGKLVALALGSPFYAFSFPVEASENTGWEMSAIGADSAHHAGFFGEGVTIGVLDNGFLVKHPLLSGPNFHALRSSLMVDGIELIFDPGVLVEDDAPTRKYESHGASVSGVIAARPFADAGYRGGIAPHAELYFAAVMPDKKLPDRQDGAPEPVDSLFHPARQKMFANGLTSLYQNVPDLRIINNSWNDDAAGDLPENVDAAYLQAGMNVQSPLLDSLRAAVKQDVLLVFAAGNESRAQPGLMAALPRYHPELESHMLSVVALDSNGQLAGYSNRCGVSRRWCLAAPGEMLAPGTSSTASDPEITYSLDQAQGTSMAAPLVSGAAGLLKQRFPYLSMAQVRDVMLTTATPLGTERVDDNTGWGRLDVATALRGPTQLLGDQVVRLDAAVMAADVWDNTIEAGDRLIKTGDGALTLAGNGNRFAGITVQAGRLALKQASTFGQISQVSGGQLELAGMLEGPALHVGSAGTLTGHGDIVAPTRMDGTLSVQTPPRPMTFLRQLVLGQGSVTRLARDATDTAPVVLSGPQADATLGGTLAPSGPAGTLFGMQDGARVHGYFDRLEQDSALTAAGQRYDLLFSNQAIQLTVNPQALPGLQYLTANAAAGGSLLNRLRDNRLALGHGTYNQWLQQTLQSGRPGALPQVVGGQIHADLQSYLLRQPQRLQATMQKQLAGPSLPSGQTRWWLDTAGERRRLDAQAGVLASKEQTADVQLGFSHARNERLALGGSFAAGKGKVNESAASANVDLLQIGAAGRYGLTSLTQGFFADGQLAAVHAGYDSSRSLDQTGQARGSGGGWFFGAGIGGGYRWQLASGTAITPRLGLQATRGSLHAVRETGSELALSVAQGSPASRALQAGVNLEHAWQAGGWTLRPGVALDYQRTLGGASQHSKARIDGLDIGQISARQGRNLFGASLKLDARHGDWHVRAQLDGLSGSGERGSAFNLQLFRPF